MGVYGSAASFILAGGPERARTSICALALALAATGCRLPASMVGGFFTPEQTSPLPRARDCERCHQAVYREWEESLHARAWTNPAFQTASAGGRAGECTSCHAAAPLEPGSPLALRELYLDEGVTCITCHQSPRPESEPFTMRGPVSRTSPVQSHPLIEEDPLYRSSELCGSCHVGAYEEWLAAADPEPGTPKQTCQGCHMEPVRRSVELPSDEHLLSTLLASLAPALDLRKHGFGVPEDASEHFDLEVEVSPGAGARELRVSVRNRLPHGLPSGRFGRREVVVAVEWPGGRIEERLVRSLGDAIPAGAERSLRFRLPTGVDTERIEVHLLRWDHRRDAWAALAGTRASIPAGGRGGERPAHRPPAERNNRPS